MTSHEATATQEVGGTGSPSDNAGPTQKPSWAGVASLSVGVFALVMAEFLPASRRDGAPGSTWPTRSSITSSCPTTVNGVTHR